MKKNICAIMAIMLILAIPVSSQNANTTKKQSFIERASSLFKKNKKRFNKQVKQMKDDIGLDGKSYNQDKDIKVNGEYYMPIYDVNLFKGSEAQEMRNLCEQVFRTRYPEAVLMSSALPQTDWIIDNVKKDGIIVGYRETMYCYVLGQDGGDGYINMKFTFQRYKDVGKSYTNVKGVWPMLSRINIIPKSAFGELKDN